MGQVVLRKENRHIPIPEFGETLADHPLHEQLFLDPDRNGGPEADQSPGRKRIVGFQQSLECQEGLVIKRDRPKIPELKPASSST